MQPYFLPYIGYFSLVKHTDKFILLDDVQYIRHGWIERNRILKQAGGWMYIKVPIIKNSGRETLIKNIQINNQRNWKGKILAQLQHYKRNASHYAAVIRILKSVFEIEYNSIVTLNKAALEAVCAYLGIKTQICVFSEMGLDIEKVNAPDEWALNICRAMDNVNEYWNSEGGISFFDTQKYTENEIDIQFIRMKEVQYSQKSLGFETNLSIIDLLMFNDVKNANQLIDEFYFL